MILFQLLLVLFMHPLHVSVTEIQYSEKDKALQIISRIYIDDLELAIRNQLKQESLDLLAPKNGMTTNQMVSNYLKDKLRIKLNGKPAKIHFLTHEIEDLAIICYLEIENVKKISTMEITDAVIQEIHDDQSNLVHVTYKSPVKSFRLTRDHPTDVIPFNIK